MPGNRLKLLFLLAAASALVTLTGCDLQETADVDNGRQLFVDKCGSCHILKEAGTTAEVGPDLDAAFKQSRQAGQDADTIEGVVEAQIENPRVTDPDDPTFMPANLVKGEDAEDVAAYVASVAGIPGVKPPVPPDAPPGAQVFLAQGCASCHTIAALGDAAQGTTGPNLDEVLPGQDAAQVKKSIVDPDAAISQGFMAGVMPDNYQQLIAPKELADLVEFLVEEAGKKQ